MTSLYCNNIYKQSSCGCLQYFDQANLIQVRDTLKIICSQRQYILFLNKIVLPIKCVSRSRNTIQQNKYKAQTHIHINQLLRISTVKYKLRVVSKTRCSVFQNVICMYLNRAILGGKVFVLRRAHRPTLKNGLKMKR